MHLRKYQIRIKNVEIIKVAISYNYIKHKIVSCSGDCLEGKDPTRPQQRRANLKMLKLLDLAFGLSSQLSMLAVQSVGTLLPKIKLADTGKLLMQ